MNEKLAAMALQNTALYVELLIRLGCRDTVVWPVRYVAT
jgi:hypothetical protein